MALRHPVIDEIPDIIREDGGSEEALQAPRGAECSSYCLFIFAMQSRPFALGLSAKFVAHPTPQASLCSTFAMLAARPHYGMGLRGGLYILGAPLRRRFRWLFMKFPCLVALAFARSIADSGRMSRRMYAET